MYDLDEISYPSDVYPRFEETEVRTSRRTWDNTNPSFEGGEYDFNVLTTIDFGVENIRAVIASRYAFRESGGRYLDGHGNNIGFATVQEGPYKDVMRIAPARNFGNVEEAMNLPMVVGSETGLVGILTQMGIHGRRKSLGRRRRF